MQNGLFFVTRTYTNKNTCIEEVHEHNPNWCEAESNLAQAP